MRIELRAVRAFGSTALVALILSACSTSAERIILLPNEDQRATAIVVRPKAGFRSHCKELVLDRPYAAAARSLLGSGAFVQRTATATEVAETFGQTLAHLPPRPVSFTFYFPTGSVELTEESRALLPSLRQEVARHPAAEILIVGHTDTVGNTTDNDRLSLERARALYDILEAEGFSEIVRMETAGRGERELLEPTPDETDEPRNRRVVVRVR
ncbi:MAG: OmpA family protein [Zoogloeaceae bacterium]|nr:OmpA family protein [Zoogloeaceae bacterium]